MTTNQHGGARPNSGRPAIDPHGDTQRITVRLTQAQIAWLQRRSHGNLSDALRELIDQAAARQVAEPP